MGSYTSGYTERDETSASAWSRFWARTFDTIIYAFPTGFLLGMAFPSFFAGPTFNSPGGEYLAGILILPVVMIVDAVVISTFGTSLGKAIAGLTVEDLDGQKPRLENSLRRNLLVYGKGLVLGLPLLCLVGYSSGYSAVKENGITSWDDETNTRVCTTSGSSGARTVLIGVLAILALALSNAVSKMS
jgi:hypothetical protein